jgi:hypothetical protein
VDLIERATRLQKVILQNFYGDIHLMTLAPYLKPHITLEIQEMIKVEQLIDACKG